MSKTREQRVDDALSQLVERIVSSYAEDDDDRAGERIENALKFARSALESHGDSTITSDVNQASDLIKKKLIRENNAPDKALQFSTLYSRLLSQPVLSQKWAILYLLYKLADSTAGADLTASPLSNKDSPQLIDERLPHTADSWSGKPLGKEDVVALSSVSQYPLPTSRISRLRRPRERLRELPDTPARKPPEDIGRIGDSVHRGSMSEKPAVPESFKTMGLTPSESALLRDLPFTLQGVSSTNLIFDSSNALRFPPTLPVPVLGLLHTLAEPCLLYKKLSDFVDSSDGGLIAQSLRSGVDAELRSYLGLIATLEGHIRRALTMMDDIQPKGGIGKAGVTLKRCVVWTTEATMGLRLMNVIAEESKGKKGGELISLVHSFSSLHGDPFVAAFAERLLGQVTQPFYHMLRQWIYEGELSDPYLEFFVSEQSQDSIEHGDPNSRRAAATSVWEDKYVLKTNMIPTIITSEFASKVFLIGKSLNFIRFSCGDSAWVESYSKSTSRTLHYGDTAALDTSIDEAYKTTMARLIHLMSEKFYLFGHLHALKKYLLLGQGDFIAVLMESLAENLDRPANSQYRHTLTAQLEHAVRNSNAEYENPDVLRRLDARMLELSHGEIGWDVFTLEYKIDAPVDVVVTPSGSKQYLKVFNFLWRVKRVEFALAKVWRRYMTGARGLLGAVDESVGNDWKKARGVVGEMWHFVCQLQYYILFEVIEASWDQLQEEMKKPGATLDDLITAHNKYLKSITRKGLLGSSGSAGGADFTGQLHELLKLMLAYRDAVDGLYSFSVAEFTRKQAGSTSYGSRTQDRKRGFADRDLDEDVGRAESPFPGSINGRLAKDADSPLHPPPFFSQLVGATAGGSDDILPSLRARLQSLATDFKARVNVLLGDLAHQSDVDMRFLGLVMNFNDFYQPVRQRRGAKEREKGKGREVRETPRVASDGVRRDEEAVKGAKLEQNMG